MYQADDLDCNAANTCKDCSGGSCVAVKNFKVMSVGEMDSVEGDSDIMKEIMTRGPVRCDVLFWKGIFRFNARAVSCGIDAEPLESWDGKGVIPGDSQGVRACLFYFCRCFSVAAASQLRL
jgi:hypothetical protein